MIKIEMHAHGAHKSTLSINVAVLILDPTTIYSNWKRMKKQFINALRITNSMKFSFFWDFGTFAQS